MTTTAIWLAAIGAFFMFTPRQRWSVTDMPIVPGLYWGAAVLATVAVNAR